MAKTRAKTRIEPQANAELGVKFNALLEAMDANGVETITRSQARRWRTGKRPQWVSDLMNMEDDRRADEKEERGARIDTQYSHCVPVADVASDVGVPLNIANKIAKSAQVQVHHLTSGVTVVQPEDVPALRAAMLLARIGETERDELREAQKAAKRARADAARVARQQRQLNINDEIATVRERVTVQVRDRHHETSLVTVHLGPTNSGKTHDALERLIQRGSGTFAGPLRMLAREAYEKLATRLGRDQVGLITGEEQINPAAPIICCTAEMAPNKGDTLILDEAHWAIDPDRGYAWTRLLVGATYRNIEIAASRSARDFLKTVMSSEPNVTFVEHDRLAPLQYGGSVNISEIPDKALVVAFSRKAVHALAARIMRTGRRVGVLYGALPPEARIEQIRKFTSGEYDVMVTTDVIGHGVNLPAEAVVFSQTDKYDGVEQRDLFIWEAAQIAGRAGRFGFTNGGTVHTLIGQGGFKPRETIVRAGTEAAAGRASDEMDIERGLLRPTYADLGEPAAHELAAAISGWRRKARQVLADRPGVEATPVGEFLGRWQAIVKNMNIRHETDSWSFPWPVDGLTAWKMLTVPIDSESDTFPAMVTDVLRDSGTPMLEDLLGRARAMSTGGLEAAEQAASNARDVMTVARAFPELAAGLYDDAAKVEQSASETVIMKLEAGVLGTTFGQCTTCNKPCAPNFKQCDSCYQVKARYHA